MENEYELQDSQTPDEELVLEEETSEQSPEARLAALEEQNKKLFARAKKAEDEAKKAKSSLNIDTTNNKVESPSPKSEDSLWDIADYIREGYTREDVKFIMANGGRKALENPQSHVSIALKGVAEQRRAEQEASKASDKSGMSEVERKYTPEQLKAMSAADLAKILPHA